MKPLSILYPVLVHIVLVLGLYIVLGIRKSAAIKSKSVDLKETSLNNKAWPTGVVQVSNNIDNQFESPLLFYVVCIITYLAEASTAISILLAWLYVALRYFHSYIHIGSNYVPYRLKIFVVSLLIILALLILLVVRMLTNA